jgi:hypothetical protein
VVRTVVEDIGLALIVLGVAMLNIPIAVVIGGAFVVLAANLHDGRRTDRAGADLEPAAGPPTGDSYDPSWPDR